ncbi:transposase [Dehalococcoidia bacterium]|nr:transposase [Dehalococcoidia bacterium]
MREFFENMGIRISAGELSNLLIKKHPDLHAEKDAIYEAGLCSSPWQHTDDTATRVNGENQHCHIVCNPLYTAYFTTEKKDRLTVLDVLRNHQERTFRLNTETYEFLHFFRLSERIVRQLEGMPQEQDLSEADINHLLETHLPNLGPQQRRRILEAAGVAAYHAQMEFPIIKLLLCDDAPQFKCLTQELALCWVHEGRHYKKLEPFVPYHYQLLNSFRGQFWEFYDQLLSYRQSANAEDKARLSAEFDILFSTVTGYQALDERIAKTRLKKISLLMVLDHPEIPLHNNPAELGARLRVRKRDVSFGPRTQDGAKAWDTFMTLVATSKKLGVSFYHYIHDRISAAYQMPTLADLITEQAKQYPLGVSWEPP